MAKVHTYGVKQKPNFGVEEEKEESGHRFETTTNPVSKLQRDFGALWECGRW